MAPPPPPGLEILRCEVGSTLHGISIGDDDLDLMGVTVEPRRAVTGLETLETWTWRSAAKGERSQPGDTDLVVYGLRKFLRLALAGNPSVLLPLYAPDRFCPVRHALGDELRGLREAVVSERCRGRFLGYMKGQRARATDGRSVHGRGGKPVGKWAAHMLRLGYQGTELLRTGDLTLPMPAEHAAVCRAARTGEIGLDEALARSRDLEEGIARASGGLRAAPDLDRVQDWMHEVYARTVL